MPVATPLVTPVELPPQSAIAALYEPVSLKDAFAIDLPPGASGDPAVLARFIFANQPAWIGALTRMRDAFVTPFGLKTGTHLASLAADAQAQRIGIFKVYGTSVSEIVLGEDDKHLNFRVSILCSAPAASSAGRTLTASTVVQCHNALGRAYILAIAPFHRAVVKASLRRAACIGWPMASA